MEKNRFRIVVRGYTVKGSRDTNIRVGRVWGNGVQNSFMTTIPVPGIVSVVKCRCRQIVPGLRCLFSDYDKPGELGVLKDGEGEEFDKVT